MGIEIISLGLKPYREVWELQRTRHADLIAETTTEALIVCQHTPVITLGRSFKAASLLVDEAELKCRGVELVEVERGGDATYHGPGQLVAYPILDLRSRKQDVGWYMRSLEEVVINTLAEFDIVGLRFPERTGVWTALSGNDSDSKARKIASLGVRISRWRTWHGFALNVLNCVGLNCVDLNCTDGFSLIHPCGYSDIAVTSMQDEKGKAFSLDEVENVLVQKFLEIFGEE